MSTPKETARKLADAVKDDPYLTMSNCSFNRYVEEIAQAIEQAVREEREWCAQIADRWESFPAYEVAAQIRARDALEGSGK